MFDHDVRPGLSSTLARREILFFDGSTVTSDYHLPNDIHGDLPDRCPFSTPEQLREVPPTNGRRLHARIDEEGRLWVLDPCSGWGVTARFVDDHFETWTLVLRKLPVGAMEELTAPPRDPRDAEFSLPSPSHL